MESFRTPQLQILHSVLDLAKSINKYQDSMLKEFDVSHEQLNILIILQYDTCKPSLSLLEIQEKMVLKTTNTSRLVNKLKEKNISLEKLTNKIKEKLRYK